MDGIDLLPFLSEIVAENTINYTEDLQHDFKHFLLAAQKSNMEDRTFYWMSRPNGTWCVKERNVFLRDSSEHSIWMHYEYEAEKVRAYRIVVTGAERDGSKVYGKVYPLNYAEQLSRIQRAALPIESVELHFPNGRTEIVSFFRWPELRWQKPYNTPAPDHIRYLPKSEAELTAAIMLEHRCQSGKVKKAPTKKPPAHTR